MSKKEGYIVALAGVPNSGKSSIFNKLTGGRAWVGNWPGVTIEKKIGTMRINSIEIEVVDLPGIYGLTAYSLDEIIARNFIVEENPDLVIVVVNATNLERSLYLALSILELEANTIVALNMVDLAEEQGIVIDHEKLSELLGIPVIPTVAVTGSGLKKLRELILEYVGRSKGRTNIVDYGYDLERAIRDVEKILQENVPEIIRKYPSRWISIKLLEWDEDVIRKVKSYAGGNEVIRKVEKIRAELQNKIDDLELFMTERRYQTILNIVKEVIKQTKAKGVTWTDLLDSILTHRFLGIFSAIAVLYMLFRFAFEISTPFVDLFSILINGYLHNRILGLKFLPSWLASLLADGVTNGVGTVVSFLPLIMMFFLGLAFLEDVGYMTRIAYLVDKLFSKFGLSGKTVIPLVIGFGCNVPAVMATRTIEDENERKTAALIAPLATCSARLPVYMVIAYAVFRQVAGAVVLSMYIWSVALALLVALALRKLVFKGPSAGFVMEMPPYIMPRSDIIGMKMWERSKRFLYKAGSVILIGVIFIWLLSVTGPSGFLGANALSSPRLLEHSWTGLLGKAFSETIFRPLNWDWRISVALIFGFIAKEIVVGTMAILYGIGESGLPAALAKLHAFTPVTGYAFMIFVLIYVPCIATIATIRSEMGSKYAVMAVAYELILAYTLALAVISFGHLLGVM